MSFSSDVKKEVCGQVIPKKHCRIAEISAIIDLCGVIRNYDDGPSIDFKVENMLVHERFWQLVNVDFNGSVADTLDACGKLGGFVQKGINAEIIKRECCKRAYIRGAFISTGTMADPKKAYHMELAPNPSYIEDISRLLAFFGLAPKGYLRKSTEILYFKESEQIADVLNIIGAHVALMEFENCRVDKDVSNAINRVANAAAANEDKIIKASAKHIVDIMDIQRFAGLSILDNNLAQVATLRLDNPLLSLEDIGKMLTPPISKSGVNHRLKKIAEIAERYRTEVYDD